MASERGGQPIDRRVFLKQYLERLRVSVAFRKCEAANIAAYFR